MNTLFETLASLPLHSEYCFSEIHLLFICHLSEKPLYSIFLSLVFFYCSLFILFLLSLYFYQITTHKHISGGEKKQEKDIKKSLSCFWNCHHVREYWGKKRHIVLTSYSILLFFILIGFNKFYEYILKQCTLCIQMRFFLVQKIMTKKS